MTLEQRVQDLLGKQAWIILTQQQECDDLRLKAARLQEALDALTSPPPV